MPLTLSDFTELKDAEKTELSKKLTVIQFGQDKELKQLITDLQDIKQFPDDKIARFTTNPVFNRFCNTNPTLINHWKKQLSHGGYLNVELSSPDKKIKVSIFDQWKGFIILTEMKRYKNKDQHYMQLLKKACEYQMYDALLEQTRLLITKIRFKQGDSDDLKTVLLNLENLGNFYWSFGYVTAANILYDLAKFLFETPHEHDNRDAFMKLYSSPTWSWAKDYNDVRIPVYIKYLITSLEFLFTAKLLEKVSQKITDKLGPEGLLAGYKKVPNGNTWDGVFAYYSKILEKMQVPGFPILLTSVENRVKAGPTFKTNSDAKTNNNSLRS